MKRVGAKKAKVALHPTLNVRFMDHLIGWAIAGLGA
jgi:hypothetical protein